MNRIANTGFLLLILIFLCPVITPAQVKLPSIFSDGMVLQQQSNASFWGYAKPSTEVIIRASWADSETKTKSNKQGKWHVKVATPTAGGPYEIVISDGHDFSLSNILIGEVWFCSGQSNMEMPMKGYNNQPIDNSNEEIALSANLNIRFFTIQRELSNEPQEDTQTGEWLECIPENVYSFSATAYYFGKMLQDVLKVPVGLISSSWGGTRIEAWMSEEGIDEFDFVKYPKLNERYPQVPSVLFNAMVNPIVGYEMKGAIWYQGESNRKEPENYRKLLPGLIQNWRDEWGIGDFGFYYAQIAPYDYGDRFNSAFLREAQLQVSNTLPNIGMACLMDGNPENRIHPSNKKIVGQRFAYLALDDMYGVEGVISRGPTLNSMEIDGKTIRLTFDNAEMGLTSHGKELRNFYVAGENRRFVPATAIIDWNGITLFNPNVPKPKAVRYAFKDYVHGDLYNTAGMPASSFRTDDWED